MKRRSFLAGLLGTTAIASQAHALPLRGGGTPAAGGTLPALALSSMTGQTVPATSISFAHTFAKGDIPSGFVPTLTMNGAACPLTIINRNIRKESDSSLRVAEFRVKLPGAVPSSGSVNLQWGKAAGSYSTIETLPAGFTAGQIITQYVNGAAHDDYVVNVFSLTQLSSTAQVTITGTAGTVLTNCYVSDVNNTNLWVLPQTVTIPGGGSITVTATAPTQQLYQLPASPTAAANTLTNTRPAYGNFFTIAASAQPHVRGTWSSANNPAPATQGPQQVGSGNFYASLKEALTQSPPHGNVLVLAQGPNALVLEVGRKMRDRTGNAEDPRLKAWFWVIFDLDPTGTILAVNVKCKLAQGQANAVNDFLTYRVKVSLGTTVVRTWGYSTDRTGSRQVNIVSISNVGAAQGTFQKINVPGHGFNMGEAVTLTSSGTMPTVTGQSTFQGWQPWGALPMYVYPIDANNVYLSSVVNLGGSGGLYLGTPGSPINFANAGSGTLTLTGHIEHAFAAKTWLGNERGYWDTWAGTGNTQFQSAGTIFAKHDIGYARNAGIILPINTATAPTPATLAAFTGLPQQFPTTISPGTNGGRQHSLSDTGATPPQGYHIGLYEQWGALGILSRGSASPDPTGWITAARVAAQTWDCMPSRWILNDTTWRQFAINNGTGNSGTPYPGMGALQPAAVMSVASGFMQGPFVNTMSAPWCLQTGWSSGYGGFGMGSGTGDDLYTSHFPHPTPPVYAFEGGPDLVRQMQEDVTQLLSFSAGYPPSAWTEGQAWPFAKRWQVNSLRQSVCQCFLRGGTRDDAWMGAAALNAAIFSCNDSSIAGTTVTSEGQYFADLWNDSNAFRTDLLKNRATASLRASGVWEGSISPEWDAPWMQAFSYMLGANAYAAWPTADTLYFAQFIAQAIEGAFNTSNTKGIYGTAYRTAYRDQIDTVPGGPNYRYVTFSPLTDGWFAANDYATMFAQGAVLDVAPNGTCTMVAGTNNLTHLNSPTIKYPFTANDRFGIFTNFDGLAIWTPSAPASWSNAAGSQPVTQTLLYMRSIASDAWSFTASTTPDDRGLITSAVPSGAGLLTDDGSQVTIPANSITVCKVGPLDITSLYTAITSLVVNVVSGSGKMQPVVYRDNAGGSVPGDFMFGNNPAGRDIFPVEITVRKGNNSLFFNLGDTSQKYACGVGNQNSFWIGFINDTQIIVAAKANSGNGTLTQSRSYASGAPRTAPASGWTSSTSQLRVFMVQSAQWWWMCGMTNAAVDWSVKPAWWDANDHPNGSWNQGYFTLWWATAQQLFRLGLISQAAFNRVNLMHSWLVNNDDSPTRSIAFKPPLPNLWMAATG